LSQGEIDGKPDRFVDATSRLASRQWHDSNQTRSEYIDRVARGGFPEAVARTGSRRERFYDSYMAAIFDRDIIPVA
jgi:uncharacterized protein